MCSEQTRLQPYFRNGLLYFPEWTVNLLVGAGLDTRIAAAAVCGLRLDDHSALDQVRDAAAALLAQVEPGSPVFAALASAEAQFMLTGVPVAQA
jgi:hypothetical protein